MLLHVGVSTTLSKEMSSVSTPLRDASNLQGSGACNKIQVEILEVFQVNPSSLVMIIVNVGGDVCSEHQHYVDHWSTSDSCVMVRLRGWSEDILSGLASRCREKSRPDAFRNAAMLEPSDMFIERSRAEVSGAQEYTLVSRAARIGVHREVTKVNMQGRCAGIVTFLPALVLNFAIVRHCYPILILVYIFPIVLGQSSREPTL